MFGGAHRASVSCWERCYRCSSRIAFVIIADPLVHPFRGGRDAPQVRRRLCGDARDAGSDSAAPTLLISIEAYRDAECRLLQIVIRRPPETELIVKTLPDAPAAEIRICASPCRFAMKSSASCISRRDLIRDLRPVTTRPFLVASAFARKPARIRRGDPQPRRIRWPLQVAAVDVGTRVSVPRQLHPRIPATAMPTTKLSLLAAPIVAPRSPRHLVPPMTSDWHASSARQPGSGSRWSGQRRGADAVAHVRHRLHYAQPRPSHGEQPRAYRRTSFARRAIRRPPRASARRAATAGGAAAGRAARAPLRLAALHEGDQQRVLDDLALRVAAADAHDLGGHRLEDARAGRVVAVGEGQHRAADGRHHRPGRELAVRKPLLELGDTLRRAPPDCRSPPRPAPCACRRTECRPSGSCARRAPRHRPTRPSAPRGRRPSAATAARRRR